MLFALATTAFAAETGTITVDNPVSGATYTAYKIFDVVYDKNDNGTAGEHYAYTIDSSSEWFETVKTYAAKTDSGLTLTQANGSTTYIVSATDDFSAPDFAAALKAAVAGKTGSALTIADGKATATGLDLGYYLVVGTKGAETEALANLTTTNPSVTIHDKNDIPFDKVDDQKSVDVGQIVNYTITGKVPDYTGFKTYTYLITDTMSAGLTFNKNVTVTVGGTDVTTACTVTYDVESNANKFTVSIPVKSYTIGSEIKVTYTAIVNENAVAKIEKNHAVLTYSNDPTKNTTTDSQPQEETVYSAKIVVNKYKTGSNDTKLAGATFVLYKEVTAQGATEATKMYYKWDDTNKKVVWVSNKTDATSKTTDSNGAASFDGLADGTYYLEETAAPAGYNMLNEPVTVTVNGANATTANLSSLTVTENIANSTGTILPSTGGIGTTIFYAVGSILVIGAAVLLVTKKRMSMKG